VVVSSDRLSSVWQPLTQLDLSLSDRGNKKLVEVELDQTELKKLVTSLEAADRVRVAKICLCFKFFLLVEKLKLDCVRRAQTSIRHLTLSKSDPDLNPDFRIRIEMSAKMLWIHYLVGVSHYADCRENRPVTV